MDQIPDSTSLVSKTSNIYGSKTVSCNQFKSYNLHTLQSSQNYDRKEFSGQIQLDLNDDLNSKLFIDFNLLPETVKLNKQSVYYDLTRTLRAQSPTNFYDKQDKIQSKLEKLHLRAVSAEKKRETQLKTIERKRISNLIDQIHNIVIKNTENESGIDISLHHSQVDQLLNTPDDSILPVPHEIESTCSFQEKTGVTNSIFIYDHKADNENKTLNQITFEQSDSRIQKIQEISDSQLFSHVQINNSLYESIGPDLTDIYEKTQSPNASVKLDKMLIRVDDNSSEQSPEGGKFPKKPYFKSGGLQKIRGFKKQINKDQEIVSNFASIQKNQKVLNKQKSKISKKTVGAGFKQSPRGQELIIDNHNLIKGQPFNKQWNQNNAFLKSKFINQPESNRQKQSKQITVSDLGFQFQKKQTFTMSDNFKLTPKKIDQQLLLTTNSVDEERKFKLSSTLLAYTNQEQSKRSLGTEQKNQYEVEEKSIFNFISFRKSREELKNNLNPIEIKKQEVLSKKSIVRSFQNETEVPSPQCQLEVTGNIYSPDDNHVSLKSPFTPNKSVLQNELKLVKISNQEQQDEFSQFPQDKSVQMDFQFVDDYSKNLFGQDVKINTLQTTTFQIDPSFSTLPTGRTTQNIKKRENLYDKMFKNRRQKSVFRQPSPKFKPLNYDIFPPLIKNKRLTGEEQSLTPKEYKIPIGSLPNDKIYTSALKHALAKLSVPNKTNLNRDYDYSKIDQGNDNMSLLTSQFQFGKFEVISEDSITSQSPSNLNEFTVPRSLEINYNFQKETDVKPKTQQRKIRNQKENQLSTNQDYARPVSQQADQLKKQELHELVDDYIQTNKKNKLTNLIKQKRLISHETAKRSLQPIITQNLPKHKKQSKTPDNYTNFLSQNQENQENVLQTIEELVENQMKTLIEMGIYKNLQIPFSNEIIKKRSMSLVVNEEIDKSTDGSQLIRQNISLASYIKNYKDSIQNYDNEIKESGNYLKERKNMISDLLIEGNQQKQPKRFQTVLRNEYISMDRRKSFNYQFNEYIAKIVNENKAFQINDSQMTKKSGRSLLIANQNTLLLQLSPDIKSTLRLRDTEHKIDDSTTKLNQNQQVSRNISIKSILDAETPVYLRTTQQNEESKLEYYTTVNGSQTDFIDYQVVESKDPIDRILISNQRVFQSNMESNDESPIDKIKASKNDIKNKILIFANQNQFENNELFTPTDNYAKIRGEQGSSSADSKVLSSTFAQDFGNLKFIENKDQLVGNSSSVASRHINLQQIYENNMMSYIQQKINIQDKFNQSNLLNNQLLQFDQHSKKRQKIKIQKSQDNRQASKMYFDLNKFQQQPELNKLESLKNQFQNKLSDQFHKKQDFLQQLENKDSNNPTIHKQFVNNKMIKHQTFYEQIRSQNQEVKKKARQQTQFKTFDKQKITFDRRKRSHEVNYIPDVVSPVNVQADQSLVFKKLLTIDNPQNIQKNQDAINQQGIPKLQGLMYLKAPGPVFDALQASCRLTDRAINRQMNDIKPKKQRNLDGGLAVFGKRVDKEEQNIILLGTKQESILKYKPKQLIVYHQVAITPSDSSQMISPRTRQVEIKIEDNH